MNNIIFYINYEKRGEKIVFDENCKDDLECKDNTCVCRMVRKIARAQAEAASEGSDCEVGCKQSVDDLLSPATPTTDNDTVPFVLYCKGDCVPFIGSGVVQAMAGANTVFRCFESPIFRVSRVKKDCCAELELLLPVTAGGSTPGPGGASVCDYFPGSSIRNLQRTGICITVDLCDFVGITCLEPVRALPVSEFNPSNTVAGSSKNYD
ncbi:CotY/CotZ family spore coat protein [Tenuibacillus multivorans]|uniref:CotY/CotZ family spore coat protein n=1 Tax=Tenuibacillus multivorans TaxID=237069 RepID=UPI000B82D43F|nr:CotY/CotZ family spore coat protein [Tenuibacillus multivorans]